MIVFQLLMGIGLIIGGLLIIIPVCLMYDNHRKAQAVTVETAKPKPAPAVKSQPVGHSRDYYYPIKEKDSTAPGGSITVGGINGKIFNEGTDNVCWIFNGRKATKETLQAVARDEFYKDPDNAELRAKYYRNGFTVVPNKKRA